MKVLLIGSFSGLNFGDSLVLESAVSYLKDVTGGAVDIVVPTSRPQFVRRFLPDEPITVVSTRVRSGIGIRLFRRSVVREAMDADLICTTAGILFGRQWYDPLHNWITTLLPVLYIARRSGTRVFALHTGVTPSSSTIERWILKQALSLHDEMAVRDESSEALTRSLSNTPVQTVPDLAFWTLRQQVPEVYEKRSSRSNICLVNVASYLDAQSPESQQTPRNAFVESAATQLTRIAETYGLAIHFVATTDGDHALHQSVSEQMEVPSRHTKLYEMGTPEVLRTYGKARIGIMTRMHAGILAASMRVPTIALAYNPKVDDFMHQMDRAEWVRPVRWLMHEGCVSDVGDLLSEEKDGAARLDVAVRHAFDTVDQSRSTLESLLTDG